MDFVVDLTTTQNNKGITTIVTYQSILCLKKCSSLFPEYFQRVTHQNCHTLKADLLPQAEIKISMKKSKIYNLESIYQNLDKKTK